MPRHVILVILVVAAACLVPCTARAGEEFFDQLTRMALAPAGSWSLYKTTPGDKNPLIDVHSMRVIMARRTKTQMEVELKLEIGKKAMVIRSVFRRRGGKWQGVRVYLREQDGSVSFQKADSNMMAAQLQVQGKLVGSEVVKTKAGTFRCKRYKQPNAFGEVVFWTSDEVHPVGMVKAVTPMVTNELVAYGKGARPLFTAAELRRARPLKKKQPKKTKR